MKEVYDFLKRCGTYYIASMDGDQPRVRPFATMVTYEGKLYFQTIRNKKVSKQLSDNPKIEISSYDGDKWIRLEALAVNDDKIEVKQLILEDYPPLRAQYTAEDTITQTFYLKDATATFYSFTEAPVSVTF